MTLVCWLGKFMSFGLGRKNTVGFSAAVFGDLGGVICVNFWLCELVLA